MPLSQTSSHADDHNPETPSIASGGGFTVPPPPIATESRAPADQHDKASASQQHSQLLSTDERFSQSDPRSAEGSQASNATTASDPVFTPTPSDDGRTPNHYAGPSQDSQLLQLSALASVQDRMVTDGNDMSSRKRMADGEVKSPTKGHSRNTSAVSMASTTSTIGDVSL